VIPYFYSQYGERQSLSFLRPKLKYFLLHTKIPEWRIAKQNGLTFHHSQGPLHSPVLLSVCVYSKHLTKVGNSSHLRTLKVPQCLIQSLAHSLASLTDL
jgi:hypothetical protein